ncbi:MAG: hypothetical protein IJV15_00415 [Lachnospiraceae bacterium]|nr:hypothetical protein [Lachnospiraceae bacterium]
MKKTYMGLIIWIIIYSVLMSAVAFLPIRDWMLLSRILMVFTAAAVVCLMAIIYVQETVYWMSGISFEQAVSVGSEHRKRFAFLHMRLFGIFAVFYALYSIVAHVLHIEWWVDIIVFTVALIAVCIYSNKYKL